MTLITSEVAQTIFHMVDFGATPGRPPSPFARRCSPSSPGPPQPGNSAFYQRKPRADRRAFGAAIALHGGFAGINPAEWSKVLVGLVLSTVLGFVMGFGSAKTIERVCRNMDRRRTNRLFRNLQRFGGASMAFMHGAQDGQKFMSVFLLGVFLSSGRGDVTTFQIPIWLMILCSVVMALGTSIGGYRIIKSVGMDMVHLPPIRASRRTRARPSACFFLRFRAYPSAPPTQRPRRSWASAHPRGCPP